MADQSSADDRLDGWSNLLSGYGTSRDPGEATAPKLESSLTQYTLEAIYRSDGIGRRIIDIPAEDMTREWVNIEGDNGSDVASAMRSIRARESVEKGLRWAGLYGGSGLLMGVDDGRNLEQPVAPMTRGIRFLRVYDRHQIHWTTADLYSDPREERYGLPETVRITPSSGMPFTVHESRMLWFDGEDVPERVRKQNSGWGDSRLQTVYRAMSRYAEAMGGTSSIIRDFITPVLKLNGLGDLIAAGREDEVKKRLEILGLSQAMLNVRLIDGEQEDYQKHASSVSGISDLLGELKHNLSSVSGVPQSKLFGRAPQGMNATGESDTREWYDRISSEQESKVVPAVERMVQIIDGGQSPDDRRVVCNPLWQPTAREQAETVKTVMEAMAAGVDRALITPEAASETLEGYGVKTGYEDGL